MHKIRFRLGLCPAGGAHTHSTPPDLWSSWNLKVLLLREGEEGKGDGKGEGRERGKGEEGRGKGKEGKERGGKGICSPLEKFRSYATDLDATWLLNSGLLVFRSRIYFLSKLVNTGERIWWKFCLRDSLSVCCTCTMTAMAGVDSVIYRQRLSAVLCRYASPDQQLKPVGIQPASGGGTVSIARRQMTSCMTSPMTNSLFLFSSHLDTRYYSILFLQTGYFLSASMHLSSFYSISPKPVSLESTSSTF